MISTVDTEGGAKVTKVLVARKTASPAGKMAVSVCLKEGPHPSSNLVGNGASNGCFCLLNGCAVPAQRLPVLAERLLTLQLGRRSVPAGGICRQQDQRRARHAHPRRPHASRF